MYKTINGYRVSLRLASPDGWDVVVFANPPRASWTAGSRRDAECEARRLIHEIEMAKEAVPSGSGTWLEELP